MAFAWRVLVTAPDGSPKPTIGVTDAVARIDSLTTDGMGSCQEAIITALPSAVDLAVRDVIEVQYSLDGGSTWEAAVWKGYVTSAPDARNARLQTYRAVGLKQRLYERVITAGVVAGGDVATVAYGLMNSALALGIEGFDLPFGGFPVLGFTVGDRASGLETFGDALDAMAAQVGAFTVPTGESYTYDGRTWTEGEVVPAVRWGVDAAGRGYFARPTADPVAFSEADRRVEVAWAPVSAEQVNDRVTLVYASELTSGGVLRVGDQEDFDQVVVPLYAQAGSGDLQADRVVVLDGPLDFMEDAPVVQTWGGPITNPANAFDGNPATFAEFSGGGAFLQVRSNYATGCIVRVRLRINDQTIGISATATPPNVEINMSFLNGLSQVASLTYLIQPTTTPAERLLVLPFLFPASIASTITAYRTTIFGASGVRCFSLESFTPIAADIPRLAEAFTRVPQPAVAQVTYYGLLPVPSSFVAGSRRPTATVTDLAGAPVTLNVERYELSFTADEGVVTRVYAGQAFQSDDEALRVVLERLARRAVAEGGARR